MRLPWCVSNGASAFLWESNSRCGCGKLRGTRRRTITPGYLDALGVTVLEGRTFAEQDQTGNIPRAVVSEKLARMLAPAGSALGIPLGPGAGDGGPTVIGIVRDIRSEPLHPARPTAYVLAGTVREAQKTSGILPVAEGTPRAATFAIRTGEIQTVARVVTSAVQRRPAATVDVRTTQQRIDSDASVQRSGLAALGLLSVTAVFLSAVSLFVLISSTTTARLHELAVRMALGATPRRIILLVLGDTLGVVLAGIALGCLVTVSGTRLLQSLLFGVQRTDALSLIGGAALL